MTLPAPIVLSPAFRIEKPLPRLSRTVLSENVCYVAEAEIRTPSVRLLRMSLPLKMSRRTRPAMEIPLAFSTIAFA